MTETIRTISSKNYSHGRFAAAVCRMADSNFRRGGYPVRDTANRAELLLLSPSICSLSSHDGTSDLGSWHMANISMKCEQRPDYYPRNARPRALAARFAARCIRGSHQFAVGTCR